MLMPARRDRAWKHNHRQRVRSTVHTGPCALICINVRGLCHTIQQYTGTRTCRLAVCLGEQRLSQTVCNIRQCIHTLRRPFRLSTDGHVCAAYHWQTHTIPIAMQTLACGEATGDAVSCGQYSMGKHAALRTQPLRQGATFAGTRAGAHA